jgi:hypothetical protein
MLGHFSNKSQFSWKNYSLLTSDKDSSGIKNEQIMEWKKIKIKPIPVTDCGCTMCVSSEVRTSSINVKLAP